MSSPMGEHGAFKASPVAQSQSKPGLESKLAFPSESSKLEGPGDFVEYAGSGKLKGKKALITGGDSEIGRSVAILMAREGADISIVFLPAEQVDAETTKDLVEKEGVHCLLICGDLRDLDFCREAVEKHVAKFGKVNVLINNASKQYICKDFSEIDLEKTQDIFKTNIIQMIAMAKFALPHMCRGDSIINTSSVVTFRGSGTMVDYAATKGAIIGFTKSLGAHLIPKGIRVNAVAPGAIYTPIQVDTREAEQMEGWGSKAGLGRPGQPSEVATSFVFLASADASLYYGQVLHCYPLGD
ncbi:Short-chain dehydrogenase/reductase SDR [Penicillium cataractarum]|uniref:Short-chain dehydrogenase/reductase SDR n=1 Tax=Penicillium cataractarum TaxID=2100454 RepID=A0A9X0B6J7_9EURO|nr:Short-chain dehydrogenase/reductase SDR [Penicillium cataractarum]KAJ5389990.1 Short-chain dehydrogenase/reductase SDR [Penicillium cataractarum]